MTSEALEIIGEYLAAKDARLRMNAATALAALGTAEGAERLMRLAIEDEQEEVRVHALDEFRAAKGLPLPVSYLSERLRDDRYAGRTSWALGYLRSLGDFALPPLAPYYVRQRADLRADDAETTSLRWRPRRGQLMLWGLLGGASALAALLAAFWVLADPVGFTSDVGSAVAAGGLFIAPLLAWAVARKAQPIWGRQDRMAALVSELWWCAVGVAIVGLPWAVVMALGAAADAPTTKLAWWRVAVAFVLMTMVAAATARLGAMLSQGLGRGWRQRLGGCVLGGTWAMVTVTVAAQVLVFGMASESPDLVREFWLVFLPIGFGVALASAVVESAHRSSQVPIGRVRWASVLALCVGTGIVTAYFFTVLGRERSTPSHLDTIVVDGKKAPRDFTVTTVPAAFRLDVKTPQSVELKAPPGENPDLVVQLFAASPRSLIKDWDDPPEMLEALQPGTYDVVVTTYQASRQVAALGISEVYALILDREYWPRRESHGGPTPIGEGRIVVNVHDYGFRPGSQASIETEAGTVRVGSRLQLERPDDVKQGPGWIAEMDAAATRPMTVEAIIKRADFTEVQVKENKWVWDSRWISSVSDPAADGPVVAARSNR